MHADLDDHGLAAVAHGPQSDLHVLQRRRAQGGDGHPLADVGHQRHRSQGGQRVTAPAQGQGGPGRQAPVGPIGRLDVDQVEGEAADRHLLAG